MTAPSKTTVSLPKHENTFYVLAIFVILGIVYSPSLFLKYIYHDEVTFLIHRQPFLLHQNFYSELQIGRPGNAILITVYDWFLNSINSIQATRWIALLELTICARLCMILFQRFLNNKILSLLAAVLLFTLPPFQVFMSYSGNVAWHTTLFLSTLSAWILHRETENHPQESLESILKRRSWIPASLFFLSLLIYPAAAMFYWAILALIILGQPFEQQKRSSLIFGSVGLIGLASYSVMLGIFKIIFPSIEGIYNPYSLSLNILHKIIWFIREPLTNALNLHNIDPQPWIAFSWAAFVILSIFMLRIKTKPSFEKIAFYSILFPALLILSFLPNLAAQADVAFYRCTAGLSALIFIAVAASIHFWIKNITDPARSRIYLIVFLIFFFAGTHQAFSNTLNRRALPSTMELLRLEIISKHLNFERFNRIHVMRPLPSDQYRYDEFGTISNSFMDVSLFFSEVSKSSGQSVAPRKPDLTTHFIIGFDDPQGLPEEAMRVKRVHVYLKNGESMIEINSAEDIPAHEIIIDLQTSHPFQERNML